MRRRTALTAAVLGPAAVLSTAGAASASETWCEVDPPVVIVTPQGNLRVVYVVTLGPLLHVAQLLVPAIECQVKPTDDGNATRVTMDVTVRASDWHKHAVRSEVWTRPLRTGTLLSVEEGVTGEPMRHRFKLGVA